MRKASEPIPEVGSQSFQDFDEFRQSLRGWDTDPFQLSPGPLQLRYDFLRVGELTIARLHVNQRVADSSALESGARTFVVTLAPKHWCGVYVPPGSVVVMGDGREYRSVLEPGWKSIEFTVSDALLREVALPWADAGLRDLAPEGCVFPLRDRALAQVTAWARRLFVRIEASSGGGEPTPHAPELEWCAAEAREEVLSTILPALFPRQETTPPRPHPHGRRVNYELAREAIRLYEASYPRRPTIADLSGALGISRRTLELAFRSALGCSPFRYFRARRLGDVRRELFAGRRVTEAALAHRFVSLGRFSDQYRGLFGELPSDTVRHARVNHWG